MTCIGYGIQHDGGAFDDEFICIIDKRAVLTDSTEMMTIIHSELAANDACKMLSNTNDDRMNSKFKIVALYINC